jgi:hypothetical protein
MVCFSDLLPFLHDSSAKIVISKVEKVVNAALGAIYRMTVKSWKNLCCLYIYVLRSTEQILLPEKKLRF